MSRLSAAVARVVLAVTLLASCSTEPPVGDALAIEHVAVVNVVDGSILADQTVLIVGNRISHVGSSVEVEPPAGARLIEGRGTYLIPGLWDMHVHVLDPDAPGGLDVSLPLFVANGVTGIRDLGSSSLDSILELRTAIQSGRRIGPRMQVAGKLLDGSPMVFPPDAVLAASPEDARHLVDSLAARGVDVIKTYEMLQRDVFLAAVQRAGELGLPVAAHVPLVLDATEAAALGVRSLEHLRNLELACSGEADQLRAARTERLAIEAARPEAAGFAFDWSMGYGPGALVRASIHAEQRPRALATHDPVRCRALLAGFVRSGTWQVPTLFLLQRGYLRVDTTSSVRATSRYVPPTTWELWEADARSGADAPPEARAALERQGAWHFELVRAMREAGVGLLAGTDVSNPYMVPGFSLHEELAMLARAGLTPLEALRAATLGPAQYLGATDSLGSVAPGRVADLVLLAADPLEDIENIRRIQGVLLSGRYFDRAALDSMLSSVERSAVAPAR